MKQRGVIQAELARRLNVHPMWVSDRLRGHSGIAADELPLLAKALDYDDVGEFCAALFADESEDHDKRREELIREGYDIFGTLTKQGRQSINEGTVLDAIRQLLRELDEQKGS